MSLSNQSARLAVTAGLVAALTVGAAPATVFAATSAPAKQDQAQEQQNAATDQTAQAQGGSNQGSDQAAAPATESGAAQAAPAVEAASKGAATVNGKSYETLKAAIDAAKAGNTVQLTSDVTENVTITKKITLDGTKTVNDKGAVTARYTIKGAVRIEGSEAAGTVVKNTRFEINKDVTKGEHSEDKTVPTTSVTVVDAADVTLEGNVFKITEDASDHLQLNGIVLQGDAARAQVKGNTFDLGRFDFKVQGNNDRVAVNLIGVTGKNLDNVAISGNTMNGNRWVKREKGLGTFVNAVANGGSVEGLTIDGNTVGAANDWDGDAAHAAYGLRGVALGGGVTGVKVTNNKFNSGRRGVEVYSYTQNAPANGVDEISGNYFNTFMGVDFKAKTGLKVDGNKTVKSNSFGASVDSNDVYTQDELDKAHVVAKVGTTEYKDLVAAFAAAKDGDTVTLTKDAPADTITVNKAITIKQDEGAVFKGSLNIVTAKVATQGATIDGVHFAIDDSTTVNQSIKAGNKTTVTNCIFDITGTRSGQFNSIWAGYVSDLTFQNNTFNIDVNVQDNSWVGINLIGKGIKNVKIDGNTLNAGKPVNDSYNKDGKAPNVFLVIANGNAGNEGEYGIDGLTATNNKTFDKTGVAKPNTLVYGISFNNVKDGVFAKNEFQGYMGFAYTGWPNEPSSKGITIAGNHLDTEVGLRFRKQDIAEGELKLSGKDADGKDYGANTFGENTDRFSAGGDKTNAATVLGEDGAVYSSVDAALVKAKAGDTLTLLGSTGDNATVNKAVTIKAEKGVVYSGTLTIKSAGVTVDGVTFQNDGKRNSITVDKVDATKKHVTIKNSHFSTPSTVLDNRGTDKNGRDQDWQPNSISVNYSKGVDVEGNIFELGRINEKEANGTLDVDANVAINLIGNADPNVVKDVNISNNKMTVTAPNKDATQPVSVNFIIAMGNVKQGEDGYGIQNVTVSGNTYDGKADSTNYKTRFAALSNVKDIQFNQNTVSNAGTGIGQSSWQGSSSANTEVALQGNTFTNVSSEFDNADIYYAASVASKDGLTTYFDSFSDAVNAAKDGDTVTLLQDTVLDKPVDVKSQITLDGQNHELNGKLNFYESSSNSTVKNVKFLLDENTKFSGSWQASVQVNAGKNLKFTGNTFTIKESKSSSARAEGIYVLPTGGKVVDGLKVEGNTFDIAGDGETYNIGILLTNEGNKIAEGITNASIAGNTMDGHKNASSEGVFLVSYDKSGRYGVTGLTISNNTLASNGTTAGGALVDFWGGTKDVTIEGNTFGAGLIGVNLRTWGPNTPAPQDGVTIKGNKFSSAYAVLDAGGIRDVESGGLSYDEFQGSDSDANTFDSSTKPYWGNSGNEIRSYGVTFYDETGKLIAWDTVAKNGHADANRVSVAQKDGYSLGFFKDKDGKEPFDIAKDAVTSNLTLYVKLVPTEYSITYDLRDGRDNGGNPRTYNVESNVIELAPATRAGYVFEGWYTDDQLTKPIDKIATGTTGNITLHAKWAAVWKVSFDPAGGTFAGSDSQLVKDGAVANNPTEKPTRDGYTFDSWYLNGAQYDFSKPVMGDVTLIAKWTPVTYTITYELDKDVVNAAGNPTTFTIETPTFKLSDPTREGYKFEGWFKDKDFKNPVNEITQGTKEGVTLYAKWSAIAKPKVYTVTFDTNGGSAVADQQVNEDGRAINPAAPTREGYTFAGWYLNDAEYDFNSAVTGNITLKAKWTKNEVPAPATFSVFFDSNGGSDVATQTVEDGETATKPTPDPKRDGYIFEGWFSDSALTKAYEFKSAVKADTVLYAKWTVKDYKITYELDGGTNAKGNPASYTVESDFALSDPTRDGYTFVGWFADKDFKTQVVKVTKGETGDKTLYAKWVKNAAPQPKVWSVTLNDGIESTQDAVAKVEDGKALTKPADPVRDGYKFEGWFSDSSLKQAYDFAAPVKGDVTLYAKWSIVTYKLTYDLDGGVNAKGNPTEYTVETSTIKLSDPTRDGYTFKGWVNAKGQQVTEIAKGSTGDVALKAAWQKVEVPQPKVYTVTFDTNGGSAVDAQKVNEGGKAVNPAAPTRDGYTFAGWFVDEALTTPFDFGAEVKADVTVYAKWTKNEAPKPEAKVFTVTFDTNGGSAVEAQKVDEGKTAVEPKDPTREGYDFAGWFVDEGLTKAYDFATPVNADVTVYAKWTEKKAPTTPTTPGTPTTPTTPETPTTPGTTKPETPTTPSSNKNAGKKANAGKALPQTGDDAAPVVGGFAAIGAAILAAGAAVKAKLRRREE